MICDDRHWPETSCWDKASLQYKPFAVLFLIICSPKWDTRHKIWYSVDFWTLDFWTCEHQLTLCGYRMHLIVDMAVELLSSTSLTCFSETCQWLSYTEKGRKHINDTRSICISLRSLASDQWFFWTISTFYRACLFLLTAAYHTQEAEPFPLLHFAAKLRVSHTIRVNPRKVPLE